MASLLTSMADQELGAVTYTATGRRPSRASPAVASQRWLVMNARSAVGPPLRWRQPTSWRGRPHPPRGVNLDAPHQVAGLIVAASFGAAQRAVDGSCLSNQLRPQACIRHVAPAPPCVRMPALTQTVLRGTTRRNQPSRGMGFRRANSISTFLRSWRGCSNVLVFVARKTTLLYLASMRDR